MSKNHVPSFMLLSRNAQFLAKSALLVMHNTSQEVMGQAQHGTRGKGHAQHGTRGKGHADTEQHKQHIYHSTNKHSLSQDGSSDTSPKRWGISAPYSAHTSNTSITAQTNTAYHKMGHQIQAPKDGASQHHTLLTQATHLSQHKQTHAAYRKMGHLIGAAKRWDISAAYCAHTSNTSITTRATHLSQHKQTQPITRWVIRYKPQKMGHLSTILCSHKQHIYQNTAYRKMGHLIGAAKRWDISAAYCAHTSNTSITTQTNTAYVI